MNFFNSPRDFPLAYVSFFLGGSWVWNKFCVSFPSISISFYIFQTLLASMTPPSLLPLSARPHQCCSTKLMLYRKATVLCFHICPCVHHTLYEKTDHTSVYSSFLAKSQTLRSVTKELRNGEESVWMNC